MGIAGSILKKFINPVSLVRIIRMQRRRKKVARVYDDAQLKLYARILKGDFLHYGYFDDPTVQPQDITLNMVYAAQLKYAQNLTDLLPAASGEVLDIGCGMGGLLPLIEAKGWKPQALTPDKTQKHYISQKYPHLPLHHCKFEDFDGAAHAGRFDALITSESLQYLKLDIALPLLHQVSKPGAVWIACDYFRIGDKAEKSGHRWNEFVQKLAAHGWRLESERDITPHILPTIAYVYMWGNDIGRPVMEFGIEKLQTKNPGLHYAFAEAIGIIQGKVDKNLETVSPQIFAANKQYKLLTLRKA